MAVLASVSLLGAACGGDDSGGGLSADQSAAVDRVLEQAQEQGLEVDRSCTEEVAAQLSPEDAKKIAEAAPDDDPQLSDAGEALAAELFSCLDRGALADMMVSQLEESGMSVDRSCIEDLLQGASAEQFMGADGPSEELLGQFFECVDMGG
jgi:hypothetical protein